MGIDINAGQNNKSLLRKLDKGIDDMEIGRESPLGEAFEKITELRNIRRNAKVSDISSGFISKLTFI